MPSPEIHAAVLAGGMSRRFGSDKCLASLPGDDLTFLQRVVEACRHVAERVVIFGHPRAGLAGFADEVIEDAIPEAGPLVGLHTALRHSSTTYVLLAACDQPYLTGTVLARLACHRREAEVILFGPGEHPTNPFPSLIDRRRMLPVIEERLRMGDRSLASVYNANGPLHILTVEPDPAERAALRDIDSPADLR